MTPLYVGFGAMGLNLLLNLTLIWWLSGVGLAAATAATSMVQCLTIGWLLERRLGGFDAAAVSVAVAKALAATFGMTVAGYFALLACQEAPEWSGRAVRILVPLAVSLVTYFSLAAALRFQEPWDLIRVSRRSAEPLNNSEWD